MQCLYIWTFRLDHAINANKRIDYPDVKTLPIIK